MNTAATLPRTAPFRRWMGAWALLLWVGAVALWGSAQVRGASLGVMLGAGGSDARGEAWRMARSDPEARRALEEAAAQERRLVRDEERVQLQLHVGVCALAALGMTFLVGWWRGRAGPGPSQG